MTDFSGDGRRRPISSALRAAAVVVTAVLLGMYLPTPAQADPGYTPPHDCGSPNDSGPRLELWEAVKNHPVAPPANPSPNIFVTESWALKDGNSKQKQGKYNLLAIPRARVTGVECPEIWGPKAFNMWKPAWEEATRRFSGIDIMLGINSLHGRRQDQLHIHLTGLQQHTRNSLKGLKGIPSDLSKWNSSMYVLRGGNETHVYRIVRVENLDNNVFQLVKDHISQNDMFQQSIAVVSAAPNKGFYILSTQGKPDPGEPDHTPQMRINNDWGTEAIDDLIWLG